MYDVRGLHTLMEKKELTVLGLSKRARMPQATVRQIFERESGHPKNLGKIARALGVELKDFVIPEPSKQTRKSA